MPGYEGIRPGVRGYEYPRYEGMNAGVRGYECWGARGGYEGTRV